MNLRAIAILVGTALVLASLGLSYPLFLRGAAHVPDSQLLKITYVDTISGESFSMAGRKSQEVNPQTGQPTLVPAMYCQKCAAWKPVGSIERLQINRAARNCAIHKIPLTMTAE